MKLQQTKIINLIFGVLTVCLSILSFNASASGFNASASEFIVPDQIQHSEFLYGEWKSNRPSAVLLLIQFAPTVKKSFLSSIIFMILIFMFFGRPYLVIRVKK